MNMSVEIFLLLTQRIRLIIFLEDQRSNSLDIKINPIRRDLVVKKMESWL